MVSFYLGLEFLIQYLNQTWTLQRTLGGLVVRAGQADPTLRDRILLIFLNFLFSFKIEETSTLKTFVEQKLSLWINKLKNFI